MGQPQPPKWGLTNQAYKPLTKWHDPLSTQRFSNPAQMDLGETWLPNSQRSFLLFNMKTVKEPLFVDQDDFERHPAD